MTPLAKLTYTQTKLSPLADAFADAANNNYQKSIILLMLCNQMLKDGISFLDLRNSFPLSPLNKTMSQWSTLVTTLTDEDGHAFIPNPTRTGIISDTSDSLCLRSWGELFNDINFSVLERKFKDIALRHGLGTEAEALGNSAPRYRLH